MSRVRLLFASITTAVLVAAGSAAAAASAAPPPPGDSFDVTGLYLLNSRYNGDLAATRGWQVTWQVPEVGNVADDPWGAVGQWYYNLESGVYYNNDVGWAVYYFSDNDGMADNPDCTPTWDTGSICRGFSHLAVGQELTFTYEYCESDAKICLSVDLKDGAGNRFLASDTPTTVEMYAHDIETFADGDRVEPVISCAAPTRMVGQSVKGADGSWQTMTGELWNFEDESDRYLFQNADTGANPAHWESCSE